MNREGGFTLIEIMIVIVLIGILMGLVGTQIISRFRGAKVELARIGMERVEEALAMYMVDNGRYPTTEQGLNALVRPPTSGPKARRWADGGYIKRKALKDPWGTPYRYEAPGAHNSHSYDVISLGEDSTEGGSGDAADIGNWETSEEF